MLTDENRKDILNSLLETIEGISNKEYQKRVWLRGEGPECDDFDETAEYFSMEVESILKDYKNFRIKETQYFLLKKLWKQFDNFSTSTARQYLPQEFIETPEWTKITVLAKEVLLAFGWPNQC